jgi:mannitol operon transcriptional antiterminator
MNLFTKRQRDILALLANEEEFIKVKKVAAFFGVAERTIRYDLKWMEYGLKEKNIELVKTPRFGIKLNFSKSGASNESLLKELNEFAHKALSTAERQFFIFLYLLMASKEVTMQQIADYLNVSKNTIVGDIETIDQLLQPMKLKVARKAHHGISLFGSENDIRSVYIKIILDGLEKGYITEDNLTLLMESISSTQISSTIREVESSLNTDFSDLAKKELYVALLVTLYRIHIEKFIEGNKAEPDVIETDFEINRLLNSTLTKTSQIPISESRYIRNIFMGAQYANNLSESSSPFPDVSPEILSICHGIIQDAENYLGVDLQSDLELVNGLTIHLAIAIHRLRNNLSVVNPLTQQIQFKMPFIYEMSKKIITQYESQIGTGVPDDEISYITMYFGAAFERNFSSCCLPTAMVICGSGTATSGLLITRLKILLPEIKIVGPVPADKIPEILPDHPEIDFIIATAPMKNCGKEIILVNPLLDNDDLNKIKTLIFRNTSKRQMQHLSKSRIFENNRDSTLADLIPLTAIKLNIECKDWQHAIRICSQPLLDSEAITEKYVNAMIKAVINYGPYIVFIPEIALAHAAPEMGVNQECLSLITLKTPLFFGERNKELVKIVVVFGALDHQSVSLHSLIRIFENETNIERIKNALSYMDIIHLSTK